MKNVLIITNLIPHLIRPNARVPGLVRYLSDLGWEAVILTPPFPERMTPSFRTVVAFYRGDIFWLWRKIFKLTGFKTDKSILNQVKERVGVTSQKSFIDYIFNFYMGLFAYPDEERAWIKPAVKAGDRLLESESFDAIISSSSPVTAHIVAKKLKEKYKIPWIADLRDLWTQNHNYPYSWWRKIFEKQFEIKTLLPADVLVTVSQPLAEKLKELHKKKEIYTITNGFDPKDLNYPSYSLAKKFTITYAGTLYAGRQDPKDFFIALKELISQGVIDQGDIEIRFYSGKIPWLEKEIEEYKLGNLVKTYEKTPKDQICEKQNESQFLLLIYWGDKKEKGWQSSKIFGYLAAQRPILVIGGGGNDVVERMIEETKSGVYCKDINDIKRTLRKFYLEYKKNGKVSYNGDMEKIKNHSYKKKAKEYAYVLEKTTSLSAKFKSP